ncbi:MAG: hypothetical protein EZS28_014642 [Streblomastix strix]|uniref:Uncharacterized protein n=1 Tax=Streblomastix strix TaxID=222440 RepID=A0A5J4W510_9EUKA|nr:MAG: hypothetical protein EZS28_014642 [Streblomastix strix]
MSAADIIPYDELEIDYSASTVLKCSSTINTIIANAAAIPTILIPTEALNIQSCLDHNCLVINYQYSSKVIMQLCDGIIGLSNFGARDSDIYYTGVSGSDRTAIDNRGGAVNKGTLCLYGCVVDGVSGRNGGGLVKISCVTGPIFLFVVVVVDVDEAQRSFS